MVQFLFHILLFCIIKVNSEDYSEINNSISRETDENDINEVFDSAEYLDTRDDEVERNNTEFNKSNIEISSENILPLKKDVEDLEMTPVKRKVIKAVKSVPPIDLQVLAAANITKFKKSTYKITSGEKKVINEERSCKNNTVVNFPYTVSIQRKGSHYATGALLNDKTVLTSAAEFYHVRESIKLYRVRLGSVDCKKGGVIFPMKSITIHPYFVLGSPSFDLAVIKLSAPVPLSETIKPVPLSNVTQRVISAKFMAIYWPRLIVDGHSLPKSAKERVKHHSMRISTQRMIPWKSCYSFMESVDVALDPISICLKPIVTHHSLCTPDPGAPVVADDVLWGITSGWTSALCKSQPSPTIFTRVSLRSVHKWLQDLL